MNRNYEHIEILIGKYLAGEATEDERATVEDFRAQSEQNTKYVADLQMIFERSHMPSKKEFDTDVAWQNLKQRIENGRTAKSRSLIVSSPLPTRAWRIAASIVLVIGIGFMTYRLMDPRTDELTLAARTVTVRKKLPDGTAVVANRQTRVSYAFNKKEKTRTVKLEGEAFFEIAPAKENIFIVEAGDLLIRDIGTAFNVKADSNSDSIEVFVQEGEVVIETEGNPDVHVRAGERVIYRKSLKIFQAAEADVNTIAYKTLHFEFNNAELQEVAAALNDVYDQKIFIGDRLDSCRLTVTFHEEKPEEIAAVIAETLNLRVVQKGENYTLEGNGCK